MDPADPFFQGGSPEIRIDPTDADFVEVFHTDAKIFLPLMVDGLLPCSDLLLRRLFTSINFDEIIYPESFVFSEILTADIW